MIPERIRYEVCEEPQKEPSAVLFSFSLADEPEQPWQVFQEIAKRVGEGGSMDVVRELLVAKYKMSTETHRAGDPMFGLERRNRESEKHRIVRAVKDTFGYHIQMERLHSVFVSGVDDAVREVMSRSGISVNRAYAGEFYWCRARSGLVCDVAGTTFPTEAHAWREALDAACVDGFLPADVEHLALLLGVTQKIRENLPRAGEGGKARLLLLDWIHSLIKLHGMTKKMHCKKTAIAVRSVLDGPADSLNVLAQGGWCSSRFAEILDEHLRQCCDVLESKIFPS